MVIDGALHDCSTLFPAAAEYANLTPLMTSIGITAYASDYRLSHCSCWGVRTLEVV